VDDQTLEDPGRLVGDDVIDDADPLTVAVVDRDSLGDGEMRNGSAEILDGQ